MKPISKRNRASCTISRTDYWNSRDLTLLLDKGWRTGGLDIVGESESEIFYTSCWLAGKRETPIWLVQRVYT